LKCFIRFEKYAQEHNFSYSLSSVLKKKSNVADWEDTEVTKIEVSTFIFEEDKEVFEEP